MLTGLFCSLLIKLKGFESHFCSSSTHTDAKLNFCSKIQNSVFGLKFIHLFILVQKKLFDFGFFGQKIEFCNSVTQLLLDLNDG